MTNGLRRTVMASVLVSSTVLGTGVDSAPGGQANDRGTVFNTLARSATTQSAATEGLGAEQRGVRWTIRNHSETARTIRRIDVRWPRANGDLEAVELGGLRIAKVDRVPSSAVLRDGWLGTPKRREIGAGMDAVLSLQFDREVAPDPHEYGIVVTFQDGSTQEYPGPSRKA